MVSKAYLSKHNFSMEQSCLKIELRSIRYMRVWVI